MTELEQAAIALERLAEIEKEIVEFRKFQDAAKKAHDNILDKIWADRIKDLKTEASRLDRHTRYMKFSVFAQVVKTKLTKSDYDECWDRVTEIILSREDVL